MTSSLLNHQFICSLSEERLNQLKLDKKFQNAYECIAQFENEATLSFFENISNHQNTNRENYEFILRDFISDVIKSTSSITTSLIYLKSNQETEKFLLDEPLLIGHKILIDLKHERISSLTIPKLFKSYTSTIKEQCIILKSYIESNNKISVKDKEECLSIFKSAVNAKEDKTEIIYGSSSKKQYSDFSTVPYIVSNIGIILDKVRKSFVNLRPEVTAALNYFSYDRNTQTNKSILSTVYHSVNLYDEKLIPKKSKVYFLENDGNKFELIANDCCNITKRGASSNYNWNCDFDMSYYISKEIISTYTGKDFFEFISTYKDYCSRYVIAQGHTEEYNMDHPLVKESFLFKEINSDIKKYKKRYIQYFNLIQNEVDKNGNNLFSKNDFSYSLDQWQGKLFFPEQTFKVISMNVRHEKLINPNRILDEVNKLLINGINTIFNKYEKQSGKASQRIKNIETEENFMNDAVVSILNRVYISNESTSEDKNYFKFRDRATFHTTLKNSYVFNFRNGKKYLNELAIEESQKSIEFSKMVNIMRTHKYHDYYELDSSFNTNESQLQIEDMIKLLEASNNLNIPISIKSGFKLRKLGNYKANGIYFSHTKLMGLDYRKGKNSYIHEKAHHIDLNTENENRGKIIVQLKKYFHQRITINKKYFFKSEELIARAAEIAILLISGNYQTLKTSLFMGNIDTEYFIHKLKADFLSSEYSNCMESWNTYGCSQEYINIEELITEKNFRLLDMVYEYFTPFWTGKKESSELAEIFNSIENENNENKFKSNSHHSYNYFYRDIYKLKLSPKDNSFFRKNIYENFIKRNFI